METIAIVINQFNFPIIVCFYLTVRVVKALNKHSNKLEELRKEIRDLKKSDIL